jgi:lauroyl/myristoyl acyltransferase
MNGFKEQVINQLPDELGAQLAASMWPPSPTPMPPAELQIRLKTSPLLRRLLPTPLVVRRAERRGRAVWEQVPAERRYALATMEAIVAGTPREHELEELARESLVESKANTAIYWQPWRVPELDDASARRLDDALSGTRGILISPCHTGPYFNSLWVMPPRARVPFVASGAFWFEDPSHDQWGRRLARWRQQNVSVCIPARGSFALLLELLKIGQVVLVYYDMPGHRETYFLGKPAMLADGCARLAVEADALVLPIRSRREGPIKWLDIAEPLDPRDFSGVDELHSRLGQLHERWILEFPQAMDDPRGFGWGDGATASAWIRPGPPAHAPAPASDRA